MKRINKAILDTVSQNAISSTRGRSIHRLHEEDHDPMQRMLNAIEPRSYIQPHKHENPDKRELFFCLRGRMIVVLFDQSGNISHAEVLDPSTESFAIEVPSGIYHSIISLESGSVSFEVKDGPWDPADDKQFAPWAPAEGSPEATNYLERLRKQALSFLAEN